MDLNKLREELRKSRPVRVTRSGRLEPDENDPIEEPFKKSSPTRLKAHTFAIAWYENDPARFEYERTLMESHTNARMHFINGEVVYDEHVETDFDIPFHLVLRSEEGFPHAPPKVFCLEPPVPCEVSYHVYADGSLCLFLPDEWDSSHTLLDVRNWACEWAFNVVPRLLAEHPWMSPEHV